MCLMNTYVVCMINCCNSYENQENKCVPQIRQVFTGTIYKSNIILVSGKNVVILRYLQIVKYSLEEIPWS